MSETTTHVSWTPGQWRKAPGIDRAIEAQAFDGSWRYVVQRVRGQSGDQAEANARLIVAAPRLALVLRDLVTYCDGLTWNGDEDTLFRRILAEAHDALDGAGA